MIKPQVLCIIGKSGSGKDTVAQMLSYIENTHLVISHTTRPKRRYEHDGVEHIFHDSEPNVIKNKVAYTIYGGYAYWTTYEDFVESKINIYIVDEVGYKDMISKYQYLIDIQVLYIKRANKRGIYKERLDRDKNRELLKAEEIDYFINNSYDMGELERQVSNLKIISSKV